MKFEQTTLKDISINGKGEYGIGASAVSFSEKLPTYLRITDINEDGTLNYQNLKSLDEENYAKYLLNKNDIVFARTGNSTGKNYYYDTNDGELVYAGFLIKFSLDSTKVFPKFIKYYCMSKEYWGWVEGFSTGSTRGNINAKTYGDMPISLPKIDYQKWAVSILEPLDKKIHLNNQMIATLEELGATLFKRWFVDFEFPDENGNPYKSSGGKMVDSELGEIPEGWSTTALGSQVSFEYGKSLTKSQRNFGTIPVYGSNGIVDYHDKELVSGPGIIIGRKGTVGTVNFSSKDFFPIDTTFWVKILTDTKPINYFYFLLKNLNLDNLTSDSAVPGLNRNTALRTEIVVPTERIINHFERTVETFRYLSDEIEDNIGLLGDVRDSLLPKILSGEIEV